MPRAVRLLLFVALLTAVLGAKLLLVDRCGSDLPFWDQWDAEGDFLLKHYHDGTLRAADFFEHHNEHRPVFTRLLSLGLFLIGDQQWDARVQLVVDALLHTTLALLLLAFALRALPPPGAIVFAGLTGLFFSSEVSWENTLSGFQSQFYFLLLFSALHVAGALLARPRSWQWWAAPLAGFAALFSMAAGPLSAIAILAAVGLRLLRDRRLTLDTAWLLASNLAIVAAGWMLRVDVPGHASLKASTVALFTDALLHQLAWPLTTVWAAPLGLIAPLAVTIAFLRRKIDGPVALMLVGANAWAVLEAAAIAFARGAMSHGYSSRYCDALALGVLMSFLSLVYLGVTLPPDRTRRLALTSAAAFAIAAGWGLWREGAAAHRDMVGRLPQVSAARVASVRSYEDHRDPTFFKKEPFEELPYPSAERLASLLDEPTIRGMLPASVRPPVALTPDAATHAFNVTDARIPDSPPRPLLAWLSVTDEPARFESLPFEITHSRVSVHVASSGTGTHRVVLVDQNGRSHEPSAVVRLEEPWRRYDFKLERGSYRLVATHTGPGWFRVTQPLTNTPVSLVASKVVRLGPWLLAVSAVAAIGVLLWLLRSISSRIATMPARS